MELRIQDQEITITTLFFWSFDLVEDMVIVKVDLMEVPVMAPYRKSSNLVEVKNIFLKSW